MTRDGLTLTGLEVGCAARNQGVNPGLDTGHADTLLCRAVSLPEAVAAD
jgi:hypothetical protein